MVKEMPFYYFFCTFAVYNNDYPYETKTDIPI